MRFLKKNRIESTGSGSGFFLERVAKMALKKSDPHHSFLVFTMHSDMNKSNINLSFDVWVGVDSIHLKKKKFRRLWTLL